MNFRKQISTEIETEQMIYVFFFTFRLNMHLCLKAI